MPESNRIVKIINDVLKREGEATQDPADKGGRTSFGISEKANPQAWADGSVSEAEAREIYLQKYVKFPGFDRITDAQLQAQLVDFGVNSGPQLAIRKLQEILGVSADGVLGPETLSALATVHPEDVNSALVASRVRMIGKIVSKDPSQLKFLSGWLSRAVEFLS